MKPRFTFDDLCAANDAWGCNCGPGSAAAILGLTLDEVRPLFAAAGFDSKRYTNPTMMFDVLNASAGRWQRIRTSQPSGAVAHMPWWGLCRVQWQGPWTQTGVPARAAYRHTHWVGAAKNKADGSIGVFDINAMACTEGGAGWVGLRDWSTHIVPRILEDVKRASGGWHITHAIEVEVAS